MHQTTEVILSPVFASPSLPSSVRLLELGRWTRPVSKSGSKDRTRFATLGEKSPIFQDALKSLRLQDEDLPGTRRAKLAQERRSKDSYWAAQKVSPSWQAVLGYVLHNRVPDKNDDPSSRIGRLYTKDISEKLVTRRGVTKDETEWHRAPPFAAQAPGLTTALSYFQGAPYQDRRRSVLSSQLIVRLTPSPLGKTGVQSLLTFPRVEMVFSFDQDSPRAAVGSSDSNDPYNFRIDNNNSVTLRAVNAVLQDFAYDLALPNKAVDIRFQKQDRVQASLEDVMRDSEFHSYVEAIVSSLRSGDDLRAPQDIQLRISPWMMCAQSAKNGRGDKRPTNNTEDIRHKYFLAGFEHRSRRRFGPVDDGDSFVGGYFSDKHALNIHLVEGGLSGGQRTEVFIQRNLGLARRRNQDQVLLDTSSQVGAETPDEAEALKSGQTNDGDEHKTDGPLPLLRTALSMVELIEKVHNREISSLEHSTPHGRPKDETEPRRSKQSVSLSQNEPAESTESRLQESLSEDARSDSTETKQETRQSRPSPTISGSAESKLDDILSGETRRSAPRRRPTDEAGSKLDDILAGEDLAPREQESR